MSLTAIECVTLTAPDIGAVERAYTGALGFCVVARKVISAPLAASWNAPAVAGRECVELAPQSRARCLLRLVESPATAGHVPMLTHGWNINELLVQDPDALAMRLAGSKFRILGMPRALEFNPKITAMEVQGPAGELLYLSRLPGEGGQIRATAQTFVDRTFIVAVGGPDLEALRVFYRDTLGLAVSPAFPVRMPALQRAWQQKPEGTTRLAVAAISDGFAIELDEFPSSTHPRPCRDGELPPGIAMVTFAVKSIPHDRPGIDSVQSHALEDHGGRRSAVLRGPAGELIELIESQA